MFPYIIIPITLFSLLILVLFFVSWSRSKKTKKHSISPDIKQFQLIRANKFYEMNRDKTVEYLKAVYPTSNIDSLSSIDLGKLYNSLWMWYNCECEWGPQNVKQSYNPGFEKVCWQRLPGCSTTYPVLPYTPQGWIYDFNKYMGTANDILQVGNQITFSDSSANPKDVSSSVPGRTFWFANNGPGPVWMYQRAIFRYCFNPGFGDVIFRNNKNYQTPALTPGDINDPELPLPWKLPSSWWMGVKNNEYLEVTAASEPGLAPSPPICWFDGWRGSGTWINVGKTLICRNKVDGVFKMVQEAITTKEGRTQMLKYFNTDSPYEVCKKLVSWQKDLYNGRGACPINGPVVYDGVPSSPSYMKNIEYNFCNSSGTNQGSIPGLFAQTNMNTSYYFTIIDWFDWCGDEQIPMPDSCVDKMRFGTTYLADRQAAIMTFDEPLFALGQYLGYDSIQLTHSSNGNGRYQYEYLELRGYPKEVANRDYSSFIMTIPQPAPTLVDYRVDFIMKYIPSLQKLFSHRDILDPVKGPSKEMIFAAEWKDSVKVPVVRPNSENFDNTKWKMAQRSLKYYANRKENEYIPLNEENAYWDDGCPVNKSALGYLWEYNITGKNHISDMFTKLSIANFGLLGDKNIQNSANYCIGGVGQAVDVNNFGVIVNPDVDMPYA